MSIDPIINHITALTSAIERQPEKNVDIYITQVINPCLKNLVEAIQGNQEGNSLLHVFKKWLNRGDQPNLINHIDELAVYLIRREPEELGNLKELMQRPSLSVISNPISAPKAKLPDHLAHLSPKVLQTSLNKSYKVMQKCARIAHELEKIDCNPEERLLVHALSKNLQVWAIHYLARGAKITLIDELHTVTPPLPFTELLHDNALVYYRGDGGAIIDLFLAKAQFNSDDFPCIVSLTLLRNKTFEFFTRKICFTQNINFQDVSTYERRLESKVFVDVSKAISSLDWQNMQIKLKTMANELIVHQNVFIGGACKFCGQEVVLLLGNGDGFNDLDTAFKNQQSVNGFYPEMLSVKHALLATGVGLDELLDSNPLNDVSPLLETTSQQPLRLRFSSSQVYADAIRLQAKMEDYASAVKNSSLALLKQQIPFLHELCRTLPFEDLKQPLLQQPAILDAFHGSVQNLMKRIDIIISIELGTDVHAIKFQRIKIELDLCIEEILFLMNFHLKSLAPTALTEAISTLRPKAISGIQKLSYTFTSGMSCYSQIAEALLEIWPGEKLNTSFMKGSYYELQKQQGFSEFTAEHYIDVQPLDGFTDVNVIYTDIYPNFVPLKEVKK